MIASNQFRTWTRLFRHPPSSGHMTLRTSDDGHGRRDGHDTVFVLCGDESVGGRGAGFRGGPWTNDVISYTYDELGRVLIARLTMLPFASRTMPWAKSRPRRTGNFHQFVRERDGTAVFNRVSKRPNRHLPLSELDQRSAAATR
jgi:hypothetical protein